MNNLFIIVGASGVGKSQLTSYIRREGGASDFHCIQKYTNRPMRKEEISRDFQKELDLIFVDKLDPKVNEDNSFIYKRGDYYYWVEFDHIAEKIKKHKNCFILTTGFKDARAFKRKFLYEANCVICYVHSDPNIIRERMRKDNYTEEEIDFRVNRTLPIWDEYVKQNYNTVQHCILNIGSLNDLYRQIDNLVSYYN